MKKITTPINLVVPKVPKQARKYITSIASKSPRGRDGEFCSPWMQEMLDDFEWAAHGLEKPSLIVFSRWFMNVCKRGGLGNGKRKASIPRPIVPKDVVEEIIADVEGHCGRITDGFLGSERYIKLAEKYEKKYHIPNCKFAEILISRRKRTPSNKKGLVYLVQPAPETRPNDVKIGFTSSLDYPYQRVEKETRNTRSENPRPIGYFYASKADEQRILNKFKHYKIKECKNREMHKFPNIQEAVDTLKLEIEKSGGKIEEYFLIKH